jgi:hypothetical protein
MAKEKEKEKENEKIVRPALGESRMSPASGFKGRARRK